MNIKEWNKESYKDFLNYLVSIKEDKYKEFHSKLCTTSKYEILGIRLPIMRKIAKEICKTNIEDFLNLVTDTYYEEVMITGLVIASIKDEVLFDKYFYNYISKIDNWAICDSFSSSTKIMEKNKKYFDIALDLCLSEYEYVSRLGFVLILNYYVNREYLKEIFSVLNRVKSDKYYVNMAQAWLVCEIYVKCKEEGVKYLQNNKLSKFTHNKAISKIKDSFRCSKEEKTYLETLRKK